MTVVTKKEYDSLAMKTASPKTDLTNWPLKLAMVGSRQTQGAIAQAAGIGEVRLSAIVRGRVVPTLEEQRTLAKTLRRRVADLFVDAAQQVAS